MKKNKIAVSLLAAALFVCSATSLFAGGAKEAAAPQAAPASIQLWSYVPLDNPGLYLYIDKFNHAQSGVKLEGKFIPFAEFKRQLTVALTAKTAPDCALVDNPDFASYIALGAFEPLDARIAKWDYGKNDFYPGPWQSSVWQGQQYGIPFETNTLVLFYNVDMFNAAGLDPNKPPKTWEELTQYAATLTKGGVYGLSVSAVASEEGTFQWLPFLQQNGGDIYHLDSPEAAEAMQLWVDWVKKGYVTKEIVSMDQWAGVRVQFMKRQAAMMINGPWCNVPMQNEAPDLNWKIALLPARKKQASAMGGVDFGIVKGGNGDAAWEFVKWLYRPEISAEFWHTFGTLPLMPKVAATAPYWKGDPNFEVLLEQMKYAAPRGPHPKWPQISAAIYTAMQEALTGVKSSEQAMKDAAKRIQQITA